MNQDLHIHTIWSAHDKAVAPEQTLDLIAKVRHARIIGISDHFEDIVNVWEQYRDAVKSKGFIVGTEVDGSYWVSKAMATDAQYFVYHCRDTDAEYQGLEALLSTGKPVIVAHPNFLNTNLDRVPSQAIIEISNRYTWRSDWHEDYGRYKNKFRFVLSSDAHQPNWLNQTMAAYIANDLGICETIIF